MRIGFDCSAAFLKNRTGVGNYSYGLIHALSKIDKENEYFIYPFFYNIFIQKRNKIELPEGPNFHLGFNNIPYRLLSQYMVVRFIPGFLKENFLGDVDVVHSTTFSAPKFKNPKKRLVVTVYDLTVLTHPEYHTRSNINFCLKGIKDSLKNADAFIAISEHTKRDLIEHMGAPESLITVTPLAAGDDYRQVLDKGVIASVKAKYRLPEKYILFVGSLEPRKNVKGLIEAYALLPENLRREFPLVIAGAKGWLNSDIPVIIERLGIKESVHFPGYIDASDISAVYSGAAVFAYPSFYEGFGLPILEAMACGTPVISSNTSSMPEVAGKAAILVDPAEKEGIAAALEKVLGDEGLRAGMKAKGLERARQFSWEKCARETLQVYRKVVESPKR